MRNFLVLAAVALFAGIDTGHAQVNTTAGAHVPNHGRVNSINSRENTILWELNDATQSGALNGAQVSEFKRRYNAIQAQKTTAMTEHHGGLSESEWKDLKKQEQRLEHDIESSRWKQQ